MAQAKHPIVEKVERFWFGDPIGPERSQWFQKDEAFDAAIAEQFADDVAAAARGRWDHLQDTPDGAVALCILLDQFPRNLYRGSARAFATDGKALGIAKRAVHRDLHVGLAPVQKLFLFLPFEHSESLQDQETAVRLITAIGHAGWTDYAERHHAIVARFGRFPHRNGALGRESTPDETEFLTQPGSSF